MNSTKCSGCMDILRQPQEGFIYFDKIASAVKAGCHSCHIIEAAVTRHYNWEKIDNAMLVDLWDDSIYIIVYEPGQRTSRRMLLGAYDKDTADAWPALTVLTSEETPYSRSGSLHQLQIWLKDCDQGHPRCHNKTLPFLPTRVIDVGSECRSPCLHISSPNETGRYVALSHCWGTDSTGRLVTQKLNIEAFVENIPFEIIPTTFQDTIAVVRQLGIPYLWIDCLCIIQDDLEDWTRESARMCDVYMNAYLTIAADRASGPRDGLFLSETEINRRNSKVNIQIPSGKSYNISAHLYDLDGWGDRAESASCHANDTLSHLEKRAWVLQETILSRRAVHFTSNELIWNCCELRMCECLLKMERKSNEGDWEAIVEDFTLRDITYDSDYLPALSGLAAARGLPSSNYLAGIWRQNLQTQLLWQSQHSNNSRRHSSYYAPSWSWASLIGGVSFWFQSDSVFDILEVNCIPATSNAYGPASAAHIKIRGKLFTVKEFSLEKFPKRVIGASGQSLEFTPDIHSDDHELEDPSSAYFALFSKSDSHGYRFMLLLRQRSPNAETVERVGFRAYNEREWKGWGEYMRDEVVTIV